MGYKEACEKCKLHYEKAKQHPKFWIIFFILFAVILLICLPPLRVSHFEINNATVEATLENQYRATLAQILGGVAIGISLYYTHKRVSATEKSIIIAQESQITERFTRAVDQLGAIDHLGNPALEIRLGGIYALERISTESEKDYWPIMEILTAYVRKNSSAEIFGNKNFVHLAMDIQANESTTSEVPEVSKVSLDIQAILTVIGRRKKSFENGEPNRLDLRETNLQKAYLSKAHLEGADLSKAHLEGADLSKAHLEGVDLGGAHLKGTGLVLTHLKGADLSGTHLEGAKSLTIGMLIDQLSKAKTLYEATLDKELEISLREKYPVLFEKPNPWYF